LIFDGKIKQIKFKLEQKEKDEDARNQLQADKIKFEGLKMYWQDIHFKLLKRDYNYEIKFDIEDLWVDYFVEYGNENRVKMNILNKVERYEDKK
jgi:hypothetical protein